MCRIKIQTIAGESKMNERYKHFLKVEKDLKKRVLEKQGRTLP